jgi:hypothetical protein
LRKRASYIILHGRPAGVTGATPLVELEVRMVLVARTDKHDSRLSGPTTWRTSPVHVRNRDACVTGVYVLVPDQGRLASQMTWARRVLLSFTLSPPDWSIRNDFPGPKLHKCQSHIWRIIVTEECAVCIDEPHYNRKVLLPSLSSM